MAPKPPVSSSTTECIASRPLSSMPALRMRADRRDRGGDAALHVDGAAAVEPAVLDLAAERIDAPGRCARRSARRRYGRREAGCFPRSRRAGRSHSAGPGRRPSGRSTCRSISARLRPDPAPWRSWLCVRVLDEFRVHRRDADQLLGKVGRIVRSSSSAFQAALTASSDLAMSVRLPLPFFRTRFAQCRRGRTPLSDLLDQRVGRRPAGNSP